MYYIGVVCVQDGGWKRWQVCWCYHEHGWQMSTGTCGDRDVAGGRRRIAVSTGRVASASSRGTAAAEMPHWGATQALLTV